MSTKTQLDRMLANDGAELAQLRDDLQAAKDAERHWQETAQTELDTANRLRDEWQAQRERIAWLTSDIGESGLAAINRLIAACERGDIAQQAAPDLSIARDEILRRARQLDEARVVIEMCQSDLENSEYAIDTSHAIIAWLAANPAPEAEQLLPSPPTLPYRTASGEVLRLEYPQ